MVVAIDGPAGSGKSTLARKLAQRLGLTYVNSGALYRGITHKALERGVQESRPEIIRIAAESTFRLEGDELFIADQNITQYLRSDSVEQHVSRISAIPEIRKIVNAYIITLSKHAGIIVEGRDMTTEVFPDADFKFYLDASVEERARRRQGQGTSRLTFEQLVYSIRERDKLDEEKAMGGLRRSPGARFVDTSGLTIDQVCDNVIQSIQGNTV